MDLTWRQTKFAWIATLSAYADDRGQPVTRMIDANVRILCEKLLSIDGTHVCIPFIEPDLKPLARAGILIVPSYVQMREGEPRRCHSNSARLWRLDRWNHRIVTGYGLTADDGMWRQHSWIWHKAGHIIETTEQRVKYFGIALRFYRLLTFVISNTN